MKSEQTRITYLGNKTFVRHDPDGIEIYAHTDIQISNAQRFEATYTEYRGRGDKFSTRISYKGEIMVEESRIIFDKFGHTAEDIDGGYLVIQVSRAGLPHQPFLLKKADPFYESSIY